MAHLLCTAVQLQGMASTGPRRKRKIPLPDWVGESYTGKKKNDDQAECVRKEEAERRASCSSSDVLVGACTSTNSSASLSVSEQQQSSSYGESKTKRGDKSDLRSSGNNSKEAQLSAEDIIRLSFDSLPLLKFEGSLIYCYNSSDCSFLCEEMLSSLSSEDVWHVGLDMEWPVAYTAGASSKVALIQVCTAEDRCYLFHIAAMGSLPKALKTFLSHSHVMKYGINIEADFWKLGRDFDIQVRNIIRDSVQDLSKIANIKLKSAERWTLDGLTQNVLHKRLDKESGIRCGKWDHYPLSEAQIQYAAADAYTGLLLANRLREK